MEKHVNYAMVGLFVILLGAAWLAISLWLALGDFATSYTRYQVYMDESVSGLYLDAPVKYRGVEIGKVREIELNPLVLDQVQLTLDIVSNVPIKEDTIAVLTVQGLTGIAFIDLTGGSLEAPLLDAGDDELYPVIRSDPSFFSRLDRSGSDLIANMNVLALGLAKLLDGETRQSIKQMINNVRDVTTALADQKESMGASVAGIPALLQRIDETTREFEKMARKITVTSDSIDQYVNNSGSGVQQFSQQTLPEFGALISELRRLADTMQGLGQKLEEDPRVLLYGRDLEAPGPGE